MQPMTAVRFDPEIRERLDKMAEQMGRPRAWIIKEAVAQYLERETWYLAEVQKGIDDVEAGRVISHDEIAARLKEKASMSLHNPLPAKWTESA